MKTFITKIIKLTLCTVLFVTLSLPCFAEVRRVPAPAVVEQGLTAITLDVEGAENFRYAGQKDKMHTYLGKIKPDSKIKIVIRATLKDQKLLPITGRTCLIRMQVTAKKGDTVLKTQNFRKENINNVYLNYTVPSDADTLEVIESFAVTNKSGDKKFDQKVTTINKLILTTTDDGVGTVAGAQAKEKAGDKNTNPNGTDKKDAGSDKNTGNTADPDKKDNTEAAGTNGKSTKTTDKKEPGPEEEAMARTRMISGAAFLVFLAGIGIHFFMKNKKSNKISAETKARKERLRQQAIAKQKELRQNETVYTNAGDSQAENSLEEHQPVQSEPQPEAKSLQDWAAVDAMQTNAESTVAAAGMAQVQYCRNCGAPLKPGMKFCENCGNRV